MLPCISRAFLLADVEAKASIIVGYLFVAVAVGAFAFAAAGASVGVAGATPRSNCDAVLLAVVCGAVVQCVVCVLRAEQRTFSIPCHVPRKA